MAAPPPIRESYVLKGDGLIESAWVRACLHLFKAEGINIRRLLLMQGDDPARFVTLEVHFVLPGQRETSSDFHRSLKRHLSSLTDARALITPL